MSTVSTETMPGLGTRSDYFEIDSTAVGARFGVAVSRPRTSGRADRHPPPLVYATDGNLVAPLVDALRTGLTDPQAERSVEPFLAVSIGYPAAEVARQIVLRNRDLVPPGEPVPDVMRAHIRQRLGVDAGRAGESDLEAFFDQQRNGRADAFLEFIEHELHPEISRRYRFRTEDVGLFGFSYGGLFTLYALTAGTELFSRFGASSPGVLLPSSRIHTQYDELLRQGRRPRDRHLHLTVNAHEMLGPSSFYRHLSIEFLRFLDTVTRDPLPGLEVSTDLLIGEAHASGLTDAYRSFVRACYPGGPR